MKCRICRYMQGINEIQALRGYWGIFRGMMRVYAGD